MGRVSFHSIDNRIIKMANTLTVIDGTTNESLIQVDQGTDFAETLNFFTDTTNTTPKDLTGYTFAAKARYKHHKNDNDVVTFTSEVTDVTGGIVNFALTDTQTASMKAGTWYFDLEMDAGGDVSRILWGRLEIAPEATY